MQYAITPNAMRTMEQQSFAHGVSDILLMEQAGNAVFAKLSSLLEGKIQGKKILLLAGTGNNGGDALVVARMTLLQGGNPIVYMLGNPSTQNCKTNYDFLLALGGTVQHVQEAFPDISMASFDAVVDGILGTGITKPVQGIYAKAILAINRLHCPIVLAIDIPSGIHGGTGAICATKESENEKDFPFSSAVQATHTVTFGFPKMGLYLTPYKQYVGAITIAPLALHKASSIITKAFKEGREAVAVLEKKDLLSFLPTRNASSHKGNCGHVLMYVGKMGMMGAGAMAALASLKSGAGLVTIICDQTTMPIMQTLVPNAMCVEKTKALTMEFHSVDVLLIGCGIGRNIETAQYVNQLMAHVQKPTILDADALYFLSRGEISIRGEVVITPHVGEAARLLHTSIQDVANHMLSSAEQLAKQYGVTVLLKNATSVICDGHQLTLNVAGSSALAKGGSGDALCGILATLLCANTCFDAAKGASLWLGLAGEMAGKRLGERSVLTIDVIQTLGEIRGNLNET